MTTMTMRDHAHLIAQAVACKTTLILATTPAVQHRTVLEQRLDNLAGMVELAYWLNDPVLERQLDMYRSLLRGQLAREYRAHR
jgi:hypothetical protein